MLDAIDGATELPEGVTLDSSQAIPSSTATAREVDVNEFFKLLDANVLQPVRDAAALLYQAPYLTRLYTHVSGDA